MNATGPPRRPTAALDRVAATAARAVGAPWAVLVDLRRSADPVLGSSGPAPASPVVAALAAELHAVPSSHWEASAQLRHEAGAAAHVLAPIHTGPGEPSAVLCVGDSEPRTWSVADRRLVHDLAGWAAAELNLRTAIEDRDRQQTVIAEQHATVYQLRALDRMKDEFVATVTHELRGPLGIVRQFADLLAGATKMTDQQRRQAAVVLDNAEHLQFVVDDLLDLARMSTGATRLRLHDMSVTDLVNHLGGQYAPVAERRGLRFHVDAAPDLRITADPVRIRQAVSNLVTNALNYTPTGGSITLAAADDPAGVRLTVTDTGIGIPADELAEVFTRFFRASNAFSSESPGTGLGLAVTHALITAHGGSIDVSSVLAPDPEADHGADALRPVPVSGTTFTVHLPRTRPAATTA